MQTNDGLDIAVQNYAAYGAFPARGSAPLDADEAKAAYDQFIGEIKNRLKILFPLLEGKGFSLDGSPDHIQQTTRWMINDIGALRDAGITELPDPWRGILFDWGVYLAGIVLSNTENVRWALCKDESNGWSHHWPVLVGFSQKADPDYHVNVLRQTMAFGETLLDGSATPDDTFFLYHAEAAILGDMVVGEPLFDHED